MLNPLALETLANDIIRERVAQAEHAALLAQLPSSPSVPPFGAARHRMADGLRGLARRLDPTFAIADPARAA
jgi:hypothetical protein